MTHSGIWLQRSRRLWLESFCAFFFRLPRSKSKTHTKLLINNISIYAAVQCFIYDSSSTFLYQQPHTNSNQAKINPLQSRWYEWYVVVIFVESIFYECLNAFHCNQKNQKYRWKLWRPVSLSHTCPMSVCTYLYSQYSHTII